MKTIKSLLLLLVFTSALFYSCSDSDPIENETSAQKSIALRTTVNELKKAHNVSGRSSDDSVFCFNFVYPITFTFNNGTEVTVTSFAGLLDVISNESPQLYLEGVEFPFQVSQEGQVTAIATEDEFVQLLLNCGINTINDELETTYCFDIVFPIAIISPDGDTVAINNLQELLGYLNAAGGATEADIVFPISVLYEGQATNIQNIYEFYQMVNNCSGCACTYDYNPVCVQTVNGIVEYGNLCHALCAGFTPNDIVNCNPTNCNIENLTVAVGNCNVDGTYALTVNFNYNNPVSSQFEVRTQAGILVGTYPLSSLPVTIPNYPNNGQGADFGTVNIAGNTSCSAVQQWAVPVCGEPVPCVCPTEFEPVCVQTTNGIQQYGNICLAMCDGHTQADLITCGVVPDSFAGQLGNCIQISYPVVVLFEGATITVNSDSHLLQYYYPAQTAMPYMVYPITASVGGQTQTFNTQAAFAGQIALSCD